MKTLARYLRDLFTLGAVVGALPNIIANGQAEDATPVQQNFQFIVDQINNNIPPLIPSIGTRTAFIPSLTFGGANVGMTFFHQWGWYINMGNGLVFFAFDLNINAAGASAGVAALTGLPFAVSAAMQPASNFGGQLICSAVTFGATVPAWVPIANTTTLGLIMTTSGGVVSNMNQLNIGNGSQVAGSGFYFSS